VATHRVQQVGICGVLLGLCAFALGNNPCYFIQRSGCGAGGTFCSNNSTVCDVGYSKSTDTGCGRRGPLDITVPRKCYTLTDAITQPCDQDPPDDLYQVGCAESGVCCYGDLTPTGGSSPGDMTYPNGDKCCTIKAAQ